MSIVNALRQTRSLRSLHLRRPRDPAAREDAWDRWLPLWHAAAYGVLLVCFVVAMLNRHPAAIRWVVGAAAVAWGGWYWLQIIHPRQRRYQPRRILLYFSLALPLFALLTALDGIFYLLTSFLYLLVFSLPPLRWALAGAAAITILLVVWTARLEAHSPSALLPIALSFGVPAAMGAVLALYIVSIIRQSAERRLLIEELQRTRAELAVREREAGVLEERGRLAREIHDTVAQGLVGVVMHLEASLPLVPPEQNRLRDSLEGATRAARDTLREARRSVEGLRPAALDETSLPDALRRAALTWQANSGVDVRVEATGSARALGPEAEVAVLRVVQESLANVAKHAGATHATVTLSYLDDRFDLTVRDNGRGLSTTTPGLASGGGYGLITMRERVEALGGCFEIESSAGDGTTVRATLPQRDSQQ